MEGTKAARPTSYICDAYSRFLFMSFEKTTMSCEVLYQISSGVSVGIPSPLARTSLVWLQTVLLPFSDTQSDVQRFRRAYCFT